MDKLLFDNKHYNTAGHAHEITYSCYRRLPYFKDSIAWRIFLDSVRRAKIKFHFHLWAYVVMPNHVHLLIWPCERNYDIGKILQAINGLMSRRYSRLLSRINPDLKNSFLEIAQNHSVFRFWQRGGGFDRNLYNDNAIHASISYIENNPVRSNLVKQASEYRWSSAWESNNNKEKWLPALDRNSIPVKMVNRHRSAGHSALTSAYNQRGASPLRVDALRPVINCNCVTAR